MDGDRWRLEDWRGGVEGKCRRFDDLDEAGAVAKAVELAAETNETLSQWRDMQAATAA